MISSDLEYARSLSDSIYRLLDCDSERDIADYLRSRGISIDLGAPLSTDADDEKPEDEDDITQTVAAIINSALSTSAATGAASSGGSTAPTARAIPPVAPLQPTSLPPLSSVRLRELPSGNWQAPPPGAGRGSGGGSGATWRPRTAAEQAQDALVGRRAEELVLREERKRVKALKFPAKRVVWSSEVNAAMDHDILSVDEDGENLWIEVKGTVGSSGDFQWSIAEFKRAVQERSRYVLVRVYEVASVSPYYKRFRDPLALIAQGQIRLDVSSLAGQLEPK